MIVILTEQDIHPDERMQPLQHMTEKRLTKVAQTRITGIPVVLLMGHRRFKVLRDNDTPTNEGNIHGEDMLPGIIAGHRSKA